MQTANTSEGQKRVQAEIKVFLSHLESQEGWSTIPPHLLNIIRHTVIRAAWTAYKIGLLLG